MQRIADDDFPQPVLDAANAKVSKAYGSGLSARLKLRIFVAFSLPISGYSSFFELTGDAVAATEFFLGDIGLTFSRWLGDGLYGFRSSSIPHMICWRW